MIYCMLKTIQIITLLQGLLLLVVFIMRRKDYKPVSFKLLIACIVSILLYAIGDDDFNLFVDDANWYFFHDILFISFLYLFVRYYISDRKMFLKKDLLYFVPYLLYLQIQILEDFVSQENQQILVFIILTLAIVMLIYLVKMIYRIIKSQQNKWMLFFIVPYFVLYVTDRLADAIGDNHDTFPFFESYGVISLSAFLFYVLVIKLMLTPKTILPIAEASKYKKSSLKDESIEKYKQEILFLFEKEKVFKNNKISVQELANKMNIPRQYLTEVLNAHMNTSFQDILNQYRVVEFITYLHDKGYSNYTLMGIAEEVGFSSKTTFNTVFKKVTGMTPSEYKKNLNN